MTDPAFTLGDEVITTGGWPGAGVRGVFKGTDSDGHCWFVLADPLRTLWQAGDSICVELEFLAHYTGETQTEEAG